MPLVNGKRFPYTKEGIKKALEVKRRVSAVGMVGKKMSEMVKKKKKQPMKGQYYSKKEGFGKY